MTFYKRSNFLIVAIMVGMSPLLYGQGISPEKALSVQPQQKVDISTPGAADVARCNLISLKKDSATVLRLSDPNGLTLREFWDTNGDGSVDQWRYFKDGIEVYRDIDSDFNKKADIYRWLNTGGSRIALDENEDGVIDTWKWISAEELSVELVGALVTGDEMRFTRLLMTGPELQSLGLSEEKRKMASEKLKTAREKFRAATSAGLLPPSSVWVQFSGNMPGTHLSDSEKDFSGVTYYENAVCMVDAGGKDAQLGLGTLIRVGDVWRTLDCPQLVTASNGNELASSNVFIRLAPSQGPTGSGISPSIDELDKLDAQIAQATTTDQISELYRRRADILENIAASAASSEERAVWTRNLADSISGAVQQGMFPEGVDRLDALYKKLDADGNKTMAAYVRFRQLLAKHATQMAQSSGNWAKIQMEWIENLETFVKDYPTSPDAAEAMLQLAMEDENAGQETQAQARYELIVKNFPALPISSKAQGALARLQSVGKPLAFTGLVYGAEGKQVNTSSIRGKYPVLIHFWTTWMNDPVREMDRIKEVQALNKGLVVIGVNLDNDPQTLSKFITENKIKWTQVYEKGGIDSRPANALGIIAVPTMILLDKNGNVVNRNVNSAELGEMVKKVVK